MKPVTLVDLETQYTNEIVCPHCRYTFSCSYECFTDGDSNDIDCENPDCEKEFLAFRNLSVTYSTYLKDENDK